MTKQTETNLLTIYDESVNKSKAIRDLAKMFEISKDEVREILANNDREIPKPRKVPAKQREPEAAAPESERAEKTKALPVCNYVYEVLAEKMDDLDMQLRELEQKKQQLSAQYNTIAMFIKENNL